MSRAFQLYPDLLYWQVQNLVTDENKLLESYQIVVYKIVNDTDPKMLFQNLNRLKY